MPSQFRFARTARVWLILLIVVLAGGLGVWFFFYGPASTRKWVEDQKARAQEAIEKQRYAAAARELDTLFTKAPDEVEARLLAARMAWFLEREKEAQRHLEHARKVIQSPTEAFQLEQVLFRAFSGELKGVEDQLFAYVEPPTPHSMVCLQAIARGYIRNRRLSEASRLLKTLEKKDPNNVQTLWLIALNADLQALDGRAEEYLLKVIAIDPERDKARFRLANVCERDNQHRNSRKHLEMILDSPWVHKPDVLLGLTRACVELNDLQHARKYANELLQMLPLAPIVIVEQGNVYLAEGNIKEAEAHARQAVRLKPGWREPRELLVKCLRQRGSPELEKQVEELQRLRDLTEKIRTLKTIKIPEDPNNADLHYQLGALQIQMSDQGEGIREIHRALEIEPDHQPSHKFLADYYKKKGNSQREAFHRQRITQP